MCHPEEQHPNMVERYVELASSLCIREWRRLPAIVSHVHLTTLQAAQQVVELQEAAQIHQGFLQFNIVSKIFTLNVFFFSCSFHVFL